MNTERGALAMYPTNSEPSVEELLTDPIARLLMQRDGLRPDQVRSFLGAMRRRTAAGESERGSKGCCAECP